MNDLQALLEILLETDRTLFEIDDRNAYAMYECVHQSTRKIGKVDAFYACRYHNNKLHFVYNFDDGKYDEPVSLSIGNGPTSWVIKNNKPFITRLKHEIPENVIYFGNTDRTTISMIHLPMHGGINSQLIGVISVQSYEEDAFNNGFMMGFTWLVKRLGERLTYKKESADWKARALSAEALNLDSQESYIQNISSIIRLVEENTPKEVILRRCYEAQTNINNHEVIHEHTPDKEIDDFNLTSREKEVLQCIIKGFEDRKIADVLSISESTVGYHCRNIFKKLAVSNRTQAAHAGSRILKNYSSG